MKVFLFRFGALLLINLASNIYYEGNSNQKLCIYSKAMKHLAFIAVMWICLCRGKQIRNRIEHKHALHTRIHTQIVT